VLVYRLSKRAYAASGMDGEGARLWGGRWNPPGHPVVYASESLSLAVLEQLVHADPSDLPVDLVAVTIEIPDELPAPEPPALPDNWRELPAPHETQAMGAEWIDSRSTAVLRVPSAVLSTELNRFINPRHADARRIAITGQEPFSWDPRPLPRTPPC
jgi:RES domain-containing protein